MWPLLLAVLAAPVNPVAGGLEIEWRSSCGDARALREELERYALGDHEDPARARVGIVEAQGGWLVELELELEDGLVQREFTAQSCELAISTTALMVAVALDPTQMYADFEDTWPEPEPEPPSGPLPEPEPEPELESAPEPPPEPLSQTPPRRDLGLVAQIAGQAGSGPLPGFGAELFMSVGLRMAAARVELDLNLGPARRQPLELRPDAGVAHSLAALGLRGCGEPVARRPRLAFPLCAGVESGPLWVTGYNLDENRRSSAPWLAVRASAGLSWMPSAHVGVFVAGEGWVGVLRPATRVGGLGQVYRPSTLGLRVRAGLEFRWPRDLRLRDNNPRRRRPIGGQ